MGIKEKLPLISSKSRGTRIAGYIVYAFVFLIILGALSPSHDKTTSVQVSAPANTNSAASTSAPASASGGVSTSAPSAARSYAGFGTYTLDNSNEVNVNIKKSQDMVHLMSMDELPSDSWYTGEGKAYTVTSTSSGRLKGYIDYSDDGYVAVLTPKSSALTKGDFKKILESFRRSK